MVLRPFVFSQIILLALVGCDSSDDVDASVRPDAGAPRDAAPSRDATIGSDASPDADAVASSDGGEFDAGEVDAGEDLDVGPSDLGSVSRGPGPRQGHHAALLSDGRVLIVGGFGQSRDDMQYESFVFDPRDDSWQLGPTLPVSHQSGVMVAIPNGRALLFGGCRMQGLSFVDCHDRVDLIDVDSSTVTQVGTLVSARTVENVLYLTQGPRATEYLLIGGTIGGVATLSVEAFSLDTGTSTTVASLELPSMRLSPTVVTLPDGRILIAGGNERPGGFDDLDTALLIDPMTMSLTETAGLMTEPRRSAGAAVLPNGDVLILHGRIRGDIMNGAEIFDPETGTFSLAPDQPPSTTRYSMGIVSLPDGRILVMGGSTGSIVDDVEVYTPGSGFSIHGTSLRQPTAGMTSTLLEDGRVLIVGGQSPMGRITAEPQIFVP